VEIQGSDLFQPSDSLTILKQKYIYLTRFNVLLCVCSNLQLKCNLFNVKRGTEPKWIIQHQNVYVRLSYKLQIIKTLVHDNFLKLSVLFN
jgi:hypothetical protein